MADIAEQHEVAQEISDTISRPIGPGIDYDEVKKKEKKKDQTGTDTIFVIYSVFSIQVFSIFLLSAFQSLNRVLNNYTLYSCNLCFIFIVTFFSMFPFSAIIHSYLWVKQIFPHLKKIPVCSWVEHFDELLVLVPLWRTSFWLNWRKWNRKNWTRTFWRLKDPAAFLYPTSRLHHYPPDQVLYPALWHLSPFGVFHKGSSDLKDIGFFGCFFFFKLSGFSQSLPNCLKEDPLTD